MARGRETFGLENTKFGQTIEKTFVLGAARLFCLEEKNLVAPYYIITIFILFFIL